VKRRLLKAAINISGGPLINIFLFKSVSIVEVFAFRRSSRARNTVVEHIRRDIKHSELVEVHLKSGDDHFPDLIRYLRIEDIFVKPITFWFLYQSSSNAPLNMYAEADLSFLHPSVRIPLSS